MTGQDTGRAAPGIRGVDHIGITVPDMDEAVAFFTGVLGGEVALSFGPFSDDAGTFMTDHLGVDARAVIRTITLIRCGNGANIELFQYSAPDQSAPLLRNSDIGAQHIAFYVDDIAAMKAHLDAHGVRSFAGPLPIGEGPAAGQSILYFLAPWGLQLEAISYPKGMAYEREGGVRLWSPKDAA
ncbi:VOC family protein [Aureimonas ureilytica]|uniref:VOC family protein n=1 Tax=Aureimonas ureilytica TaxID=401562 RepID=UPI00037D76D8|nr:VOC family protein [Aureimonas ureilytica]